MSKKMRLISLLMRSGGFKRSFDAEQTIRRGHIEVDGKVLTNPKHSIKMSAVVKINGRQLLAQPLAYIILNKQAGMVCQKSSKEKTVFEVIASIPEIDRKTKGSLFCVGRLDRDTEGLLVVTNDGQLEKQLTRKENHIIKTYLVGTKNPVTGNDISALQRGVEITDDDTGKVFPVKAIAIKKLGQNRLEISIDEGRKRQIKKMLQAVGNEVISLKRVAIGNLRLEDIDFKGKSYLIVSKADLKLPG
jgi:16S rRNA pseudouridine516 synthase